MAYELSYKKQDEHAHLQRNETRVPPRLFDPLLGCARSQLRLRVLYRRVYSEKESVSEVCAASSITWRGRFHMIRFNCKSGKYRGLSNEYGNVWFEFFGSRFLDASVIDLFRRLQNCDGEEFVDTLRWLQPNKEWTDRKEKYWFWCGEPIRGVVAKLLGSMKDRTPTGERPAQTGGESDGVAGDFDKRGTVAGAGGADDVDQLTT